MIYVLYAIFDRISGMYGTPTCFVNEASAVRWFRAVISRNELAEPTDFELYKLGDFNSETGVVVGCDRPQFVEKGVVTNET